MSMNDLGIVRRNIARAERGAVERLAHFGVAVPRGEVTDSPSEATEIEDELDG